MGTTVDKLNKLKTTKEAIRTAINNKGGTLTENNKFSDYATAISNFVINRETRKYFIQKRDCHSLFTGYQGSSVDNLISYDDTENSTNMKYMFSGCNKLTKIPLLNTSNVTNMDYMFSSCKKLSTIPQFDTSKVTSMYSMFGECSQLESIPQLDTHNVINMSSMFSYCSWLRAIPQLDTSKVTSMNHMFSHCNSLKTIPPLDTSNVTDMNYMFDYCEYLESIPPLNTSSCTMLSSMFSRCNKLAEIDITHMNVNYLSEFARNCYSLTKLIIRNMDRIPTLNTDSFQYCYHFDGTQNTWYNPDGLKDGRIYVPDDKVEELKAATNWSVFADIIVPLSTLVEDN